MGVYETMKKLTTYISAFCVAATIAFAGGRTDSLEIRNGADGNVQVTALSYISGAWSEYTSSSQITFRVGEGYCSDGTYWQITNGITQTLTNRGDVATRAAVYWYMDHDASTFPNDLVFYDSATAPLAHTNSGCYVEPSEVLDRYMGSSCDADSWFRFADGSLFVNQMYGISLGSSMNPNGSWQTPDDDEGDGYLPVTATEAFLTVFGNDAGTVAKAVATSKEHSVVAASNPRDWAAGIVLVGKAGSGEAEANGWCHVGAERKFRLAGENNDDNWLRLQLHGWRETRSVVK